MSRRSSHAKTAARELMATTPGLTYMQALAAVETNPRQAPRFITRLTVLYRDADNYKSSYEVEFAGAITREQIASMQALLIDGQFYDPIKVGLAHPGHQMSGFYNDEVDHPFCDMEDADVFETVTYDESRGDWNDLTPIGQFVQRFTRALEHTPQHKALNDYLVHLSLSWEEATGAGSDWVTAESLDKACEAAEEKWGENVVLVEGPDGERSML